MDAELKKFKSRKKIENHSNDDIARFHRIVKEMEDGFKFLSLYDDERVVTIFGSAKTRSTDPMYKKARQLGTRLAKEGITVVTGGGPGIMEAANRGAVAGGGKSVGLNIYLPTVNKERKNVYVEEGIGFHYFFARKVMLAHVAQAYVYFPGGFGTLDEFFEIITLIDTEKIEEKMPIVLIGKAYWGTLQKWLEKNAVDRHGTLTKYKLRHWVITDSVEEAMTILSKIPTRVRRSEWV